MDEEYDDTELGRIADERIQSFQADSSPVEESCFSSISDSNLTNRNVTERRESRILEESILQAAGIFHHLITLPTYHTAALSTDYLAKGSELLFIKT